MPLRLLAVTANGFQTNGLLDKEWARFFQEYRFLVELSLDGSEHIHDRFRSYLNSQGTWVKSVQTAKMFQDESIETSFIGPVF
ncbi:MAG: hypothetical protein ACUVR0_04265 [Candidatus Aminicenantales bacterium]